jgi:hypothetical protein
VTTPASDLAPTPETGTEPVLVTGEGSTPRGGDQGTLVGREAPAPDPGGGLTGASLAGRNGDPASDDAQPALAGADDLDEAHASPAGAEAPVPAPPAAAALATTDDPHVAALIVAVERLTRRARAADAALAAVTAEVDAFRLAQADFEREYERRERRCRELEAFRHDVARLAREIVGRVEALFESPAAAVEMEPEDGQTTPAAP